MKIGRKNINFEHFSNLDESYNLSANLLYVPLICNSCKFTLKCLFENYPRKYSVYDVNFQLNLLSGIKEFEFKTCWQA